MAFNIKPLDLVSKSSFWIVSATWIFAGIYLVLFHLSGKKKLQIMSFAQKYQENIFEDLNTAKYKP